MTLCSGFVWTLPVLADAMHVIARFGLRNLCGNGILCSVVVRSGKRVWRRKDLWGEVRFETFEILCGCK